MNRRLVLWFAFCLVTASAPGGAFLPDAQAAAASLTAGTAIDKAGRQRMLSQRLAKAWIMTGMNIAPERAQAILTDSFSQFENQLAELRGFAPSQGAQEALARLEKEWTNYKSVLSTKPSRENAVTLYNANEAVQVAAHRLTLAYEAFANSPSYRLINIAGRQRMLSQRMAKFWLFEAWGINSKAARMEFGLARAEFASGLYQLSISPYTTVEIRTALEQLDREWGAYQTALTARRSIPGKMRMAPEIADMSERVLVHCEKLVALYEQQAGGAR